MDYFVELATVPDLQEAIARQKGAHPEAADLLLYAFLQEEHPTAWIAEVVYAFYRKPTFAADVWKELRYCPASRHRLGSYISSNRGWWRLRLKSGKPDVRAFANEYAAADPKSARDYAEDLAKKPMRIDELCKVPGNLPPPPSFLRTLMDASSVSDGDFDAMTRALLADPDEVRSLAKSTGVAVPFAMVLDQELDQIAATRDAVHRSEQGGPPGAGESAPIRRALDMNLLGLAFSGGGIRSATFNLGVLQALSKIGLLRQCDYLSTVSGGGYIGTWLAAWIRRESTNRQDCAGTMVDIQRRLSPIRSPNPMDERVRPIRFLREYSNYLTPRTGFFSADTWTMVGIYLRNTLLNQVIIASFVGAALLTPRLWVEAATAHWIWHPTVFGVPWSIWVLSLVGVFVLVTNLRRLHSPRPPQAAGDAGVTAAASLKPSWLATPKAIQLGVVLPWVLSAALTACYVGEPTGFGADLATSAPGLAVRMGEIVFVAFLAILAVGRAYRCWDAPAVAAAAPPSWYTRLSSMGRWRWLRTVGTFIQQRRRKVDAWLTKHLVVRRALVRADSTGKGLGAIALAALVSGAVAAALTWVLVQTICALAPDVDGRHWHSVALGTSGLLSVVSLSIVAMLGMLGERFPDEHREWWSRLRTFLHVWAIGWLMAFAAAVYVPWGFWWLWKANWGAQVSVTALAGWIGSTVFGVHKGRTAEDDRKAQHETGGAVGVPTSALRIASLAAPFIFIAGLICGSSIIIDRVFVTNLPADKQWLNDGALYWSFVKWSATEARWSSALFDAAHPIGWLWTPTAWAGLLAIGALFSWRVDINDFSIHHFYKNRLVRCYLGASHAAARQANWFTGFDPEDDLPLKAFDHDANPTAPYPGPYPILNCALNLVAGQDLAWQERKSSSFVFTPKYCGYDVDRAVLSKVHDGLREDAYVQTRNYYHPGDGPRIGMAMAISGAATNPNMGRASSPALAFLMTVFNVRLGWWVGNPRKRDGMTWPSPIFGLPYTALELFGGTDDRKKYVNLSDGGHFENLGVYELVRRGCRYIVVCDAGQDERFTCEDLATLVRLCRADFGVEIDISIDRIRELSTARFSHTHCVVGKIHYLGMPKRSADAAPSMSGPGVRLPINEDGGPLLRGSRPAHEEGYLIYLKPSLTGDEPQDVLEYSRRVPQFPHQTTADQWFDESQFESYRKLGMHVAEDAFCRYQDDDTKPLANLPQLFERLHSFWFPPAAVISERSTGHVKEYTRIMDLIRGKADFAPLDHTMFEFWPESKTRLNERDQFYICNALIQLMENVYADLDLEHLWRHPQVEGWMAVFRRWAQQAEFRTAWQISEPAYSQHFRNFYNDRLRGRIIALPRGFVASNGADRNGEYPDETLARLTALLQQGVSVVHLEVRRVLSGELVVWPSETAGNRAVADLTLAELKQAAPTAATLRECVDRLRGRVQLCLDLKVNDIAVDTVKLLTKGQVWRRRDFVIVSEYSSELDQVRKESPYVRTGLVVDAKSLELTLKNFIDFRIDFLAPHEAAVTDAVLEQVASERIPLVPWLVNDKARLDALLKHECVAGVVTSNVKDALDVKRWL